MALSQQPLAHTGKKGFLTGNGHRARQKDCSLNPFMHRRTAMARPKPTMVFLAEPRDGHAVWTL